LGFALALGLACKAVFGLDFEDGFEDGFEADLPAGLAAALTLD
jgi:hypothetical protein